jgi:hypothetical protein
VIGDSSVTRRRPGLVWAIVVFYGMAYVVLLLAVVFAVTWDTTQAATKEADRTPPLSAWLFDGLRIILLPLGTIELFRLKRSSFYFYATALILSIVRVPLSQSASAPSGYDVFSWATDLFVCVYTWHLGKRGTLA